LLKDVDALQEKYDSAMDDDFNTADAIAAVFEMVKLANTHCTGSSKTFVKAVFDRIVLLCDILGIITQKEDELLGDEIENLIEERRLARKNKDFAKSDEIRDLLLTKGIILEDTREGVRWKRS
jgi:cysteinyl-tRNA synthetase